MTFNERLKKQRLRKNLLQKDVAYVIGTDRTTYVKYETGSSRPDIEMLCKIADYFQVSTDYLLCRTVHPSLLDSSSITSEMDIFYTAKEELPSQSMEQLKNYTSFLLSQKNK